MGSTKTTNRHLPPRMRFKHGAFYRVVQNKWIPLGKVYGEALKRWAELEAEAPQIRKVGDAITAYMIDEMPKLKPATQKDYSRICGTLRATMGDLGLEAITPTIVAQYLHKRTKAVAANREIAVLSSIYSYAMRLGYAKSNPAYGVRRNREKRRTRIPTAAELSALRLAAKPHLKNVIDLALMTALRKSDLLALDINSCTNAGIELRTSKTGAPICIRWNDALREVVAQAQGKRSIGPLLLTSRNKRWTASGLDTAWGKLRDAAGVQELHWHDLRAWALTSADRQHGRESARLLAGHSDASTTDIYLRDRSIREVEPVRLDVK